MLACVALCQQLKAAGVSPAQICACMQIVGVGFLTEEGGFVEAIDHVHRMYMATIGRHEGVRFADAVLKSRRWDRASKAAFTCSLFAIATYLSLTLWTLLR